MPIMQNKMTDNLMSQAQSETCLSNYRLGIAHFSILLEYLTEQGISRDECLLQVSVDEDVLDDPESVIDASQELALIRLLQNRLGRPFHHGIEVGRRQGLTAYGVWGLGVMSSPNVEQASAGRPGLPQSPFLWCVIGGASRRRARWSCWIISICRRTYINFSWLAI